jgi:Arc/MetJ-type ribon-helix-helix transcriptional regulator
MIAGGLLDANELLRGDGEWRNMQDVVRKAFKYCLDVQSTQSEKIARLNAQVIQLREELNKRPTFEDIDRLLEMKLLAEKKRQGSTKGNDDLRLQIAQVNRELEKKVSIHYLETSLNKKMDRSDLLVRDLSKYSVKEYSQEVAKLKLDVIEMKSHLDNFTDIMDEYERKNSDFSKTSEHVIVLKSQIENLYRHLNEVYTKDQLKPLLDDKVSY